jgi:hypothetical protein
VTAGCAWNGATQADSTVSSPYLRSRVYSCIREIPSRRDACILLPLVSRMTRGDYRFGITQSKDDARAFFGRDTGYVHRVYGGVIINTAR